MDKKKSVVNVSVSMVFRILILVSSVIHKKFFIQSLGNEINGVNSLFSSIIGLLSVAELGIGSAISFSMYEPIVNHDSKKISALYFLYKRAYLIVGIVIFFGGLCTIPFLPDLARGYNGENRYLEFSFFIMLVSVVMTYFFSSKNSLINAYKNDYITTIVISCGSLIQDFLQIVVLIRYKSFELFLFCRIVCVILQWIIIDVITEKKHGDIIHDRQSLDEITKNNIVKNVKAMFMHNIGNVLVNTIDGLIISAFIGVDILGKYSNYVLIMSTMVATISLFFTPLTSIIGHSFVKESPQKMKNYFCFFHSFNYVIGVVFFLGYYAIVDNLILLILGPGLTLPKSISFVITLNYFIQFMRQSALLFRDATGTFYYDRQKPILEGFCNVVFSIIFVKTFPADYNVVGVIVATIITNLLITHIVEPFVIYKHVFKESPIKYYKNNYIKIAFFTIILFFFSKITVSNTNTIVELFTNGVLAVGIGLILFTIEVLTNRNFKDLFLRFVNFLFKRGEL